MAKAALDHVVLLLPYKTLNDLPSWVTSNFKVSEGGQHADEKTVNRLVLFRDGTYLELIAFVNDDPQKRKGHWWYVHNAGDQVMFVSLLIAGQQGQALRCRGLCLHRPRLRQLGGTTREDRHRHFVREAQSRRENQARRCGAQVGSHIP